MSRPLTLAEVAQRRNAGEDFSLLLREFLDEFYGAVRRGELLPSLRTSRSVCPMRKNMPR